MFCDGPKMDEGDIARLGPTTIAGMTSLKVLFVLDHDSGRYRWFWLGPSGLFSNIVLVVLSKYCENTCG